MAIETTVKNAHLVVADTVANYLGHGHSDLDNLSEIQSTAELAAAWEAAGRARNTAIREAHGSLGITGMVGWGEPDETGTIRYRTPAGRLTVMVNDLNGCSILVEAGPARTFEEELRGETVHSGPFRSGRNIVTATIRPSGAIAVDWGVEGEALAVEKPSRLADLASIDAMIGGALAAADRKLAVIFDYLWAETTDRPDLDGYEDRHMERRALLLGQVYAPPTRNATYGELVRAAKSIVEQIAAHASREKLLSAAKTAASAPVIDWFAERRYEWEQPERWQFPPTEIRVRKDPQNQLYIEPVDGSFRVTLLRERGLSVSGQDLERVFDALESLYWSLIAPSGGEDS